MIIFRKNKTKSKLFEIFENFDQMEFFLENLTKIEIFRKF